MRALLSLLAMTALAAQSGQPRTKPDTGSVICVDPGHPSEINDGLQLQNGTTETRICWVVANRVKAQLERDGYRVVMTKQREKQLVKNVRRAEIANRARADLMLRLHCDSGAGSGFRIFYPDRSARDGRTVGPPLAVRKRSREAAVAIHSALSDTVAPELKDNGVASDSTTAVGRKKGGALIGSIHSRVPVVLVEMVFLNNPDEARFIKSNRGQDLVARALVSGVNRFVPLPR